MRALQAQRSEIQKRLKANGISRGEVEWYDKISDPFGLLRKTVRNLDVHAPSRSSIYETFYADGILILLRSSVDSAHLHSTIE